MGVPGYDVEISMSEVAGTEVPQSGWDRAPEWACAIAVSIGLRAVPIRRDASQRPKHPLMRFGWSGNTSAPLDRAHTRGSLGCYQIADSCVEIKTDPRIERLNRAGSHHSKK